MGKKAFLFTLLFLIAGVIFKLFLTSEGNFIFNMDNGRDMVEVREMVVLKNLRLIGPRTPIEGVFDGPAWYYLLAIPFIFSGGDPYAAIILQILLWAVGGFFLLRLVWGWRVFLIIPAGLIWVSSGFINLQTHYAFNPNPVTFLTPLLIYLIYQYIKTNRLVFSASAFFLGGLFFNFEMNFGVFIPLLILIDIMLLNKNLLRSKNFWIGTLFFIFWLLPQVLFDLRNNFLMSKALYNFFANPDDRLTDIVRHLDTIYTKFFNVFVPTMLDNKILSTVLLLLFLPILLIMIKDRKKEEVVTIALTFIMVPFIAFTFLPNITVNPWHLGGQMAAAIILTMFLLKKIWDFRIIGKMISSILITFMVYLSIFNLIKFANAKNIPDTNTSSFKNEIAVIDYVYKYANGKNFKVYIFIPSVYDYPYQYLFWWHGQKKYGYLPEEYAYAPDKPQYISNKQSFSATQEQLSTRDDSGLVFLIKEPNRGINLKSGWEADYRFLDLISTDKIGPIEIEIRRGIKKQ